MITEDGKCVRCKCTCRYIKYAWKLLAGYLVDVRDHEQKTLRCGEGCSQSTSSEGTVNCTSSTRLRLHLGYLYGLAEKVLSAFSGPLIYMLRHDG